ncbi:DUF3343 domain-containing protein [Chloroflexota bacterium]
MPDIAIHLVLQKKSSSTGNRVMTLFDGQSEYFEDCDSEEIYQGLDLSDDDIASIRNSQGRRNAADSGEVRVQASWRKKPDIAVKPVNDAEGIILFQNVQDAIQAEKLLRGAGYSVRMVLPPREMRRGCDLALEINLVEQIGIERTLKQQDSPYSGVYPIDTNSAALLDIVKITDLGNWTMVKAGNMKLSFEKATGTVVNTSGGGCPDIPYLHAEMIDRRMTEVERPREAGSTLCALMLDRALTEALDIRKGGTQ